MLITVFGCRRVGASLIRRWISDRGIRPWCFSLLSRRRLPPITDPALDQVRTLGLEDGTYRSVLSTGLYGDLLKSTDAFVSVVRDPINSLASVLQLGREAHDPEKPVLPARANSLILPMLFEDFLEIPPGGHLVIYERFIASREYRDALAADLGIEPNESALDTYWGGRSLFGENLSAPSELAVNERWKEAMDDPMYLWYLRYPGLLEARETIYGPLPPELKERLDG